MANPDPLAKMLDDRLKVREGATASSKEPLPSKDPSNTPSASMPPSMAERRQYTADELFKEMNRLPLFMTSLDGADADGGENEQLEALKALAYEGTRAEIAANFRDHGNEAAKAKLWSDAREFYSKALAALKGSVQSQDPEEELPGVRIVEVDEEAEERKERQMEEACLVNRALCNLEMRNYGSCSRDCAAALKLNVRNVKAWYRAASACLALDKTTEALDACQSGLRFGPSNTALKHLLAKVEERIDYLAEQDHSRKQRQAQEAKEHATLRGALKQRNITIRTTPDPPELEDAAISLSDSLDASSTLSLPLMLLYPLEAQSDFVKTCQEGESVGEHLTYILPPPWDQKNEYLPESVDCYMETVQGGLIKVGKKVALLKLLSGSKIEVVDHLVKLNVVPKAKAPGWIEEFKKRRGKT